MGASWGLGVPGFWISGLGLEAKDRGVLKSISPAMQKTMVIAQETESI